MAFVEKTTITYWQGYVEIQREFIDVNGDRVSQTEKRRKLLWTENDDDLAAIMTDDFGRALEENDTDRTHFDAGLENDMDRTHFDAGLGNDTDRAHLDAELELTLDEDDLDTSDDLDQECASIDANSETTTNSDDPTIGRNVEDSDDDDADRECKDADSDTDTDDEFFDAHRGDEDSDTASFVTIDEADVSAEVFLEFEGSDVEVEEPVDPRSFAATGVPQLSVRGRFCPVCHQNVEQRLRRHMEISHMPWWLSPNRACWSCHETSQSATFAHHRHQDTCPQVAMTDKDVKEYTLLANGLIKRLLRDFNCNTEEELLILIEANGWYPDGKPAPELSFQQKLFMWLWETENQRIHTPFADLKISPPSTIICVLHYRVLMCLLPHLPTETQDLIQAGSQADPSITLPHAVRRLIHTIDGHAHLDRNNSLRSYEGDRWDSMIRLDAVVANFVFPASWKTIDAWKGNERVYITAGIHPNLCQRGLVDAQHFARLQVLLEDPRCVALGEVGLDYFRGTGRFSRVHQQKNLQRMLEIRPHALPIIIHRREATQGQTQALEDVLHLLQMTTNRDAIVVIHSFTGSAAETRLLLKSFRQTYFSLGPLCLHLRDEAKSVMVSAVRGLELHQILLETDAPYLTTRPRQSLHEVAEWIGEAKGCPPSLILEAGRRNAIRVYNLALSPELGL